MFKDMFRKPKYVTIQSVPAAKPRPVPDINQPQLTGKKEMPDGLWVKCVKCGEVLFNKDLAKNARVCPKCNYHFRITAGERLQLLVDENSFQEWDSGLLSLDSLEFPGYQEKLQEAQEKTDLAEGVITGRAEIEGNPVVLALSEGNFMMGSMGSVVGEKLTRAIEKAIALRLPVIIFSTSGGARMQEGILSLYQMAKTSAALERLGENGLLYISVFTDPTFGGVTASYASLGDIVIAEPGALIGFTGPRVIKQTMRQELPAGAQTAEFNQDHGMIDMIVARSQMRTVLGRLLRYHREGTEHGPTI